MERWKSKNHAKYNLGYHVIWCPKYRLNVLKDGVDVRLKEIFKKGHIPGAKSVPLSEFDELIGNFYEIVPMERNIVIYCSGRECTDSHAFATKLSEVGYENVKVFTGGFIEWEQEGYIVEKN